jgi:hypothetical protein
MKSMHLVQILLPTKDNENQPFGAELFTEVRNDLAEHFGGVTTYMRAPATGLWEDDGEKVKDDVVIFEVMVDRLEREFWRLYRLELQEMFRQDLIVMRAEKIEVL